MAFSASHVFNTFLGDVMASKAYNIGLSTGDTIKLALFNNTTDDATAKYDTLAHNTYNGAGGQFVLANEVTGTSWSAGGISLTVADNGFIYAASSNSWMAWTAGTVGTPATGTSTASVTIATGFYGCLVYDSTVSSKGICMVSFGGSYTVGGGTLAINWGNSPATTATPCIFYIST